MIEVELPDGSVLEFPDDIPEDEIAQMVEDHLEAARPANVTSRGEPSLDEPSPPELPAVVSLAYRFRLAPYTADVDAELGDLAVRLPEQGPAGGVCQEVLERSQLPAAQAVDPPEDTFRDNWWPNWHRPR